MIIEPEVPSLAWIYEHMSPLPLAIPPTEELATRVQQMFREWGDQSCAEV